MHSQLTLGERLVAPWTGRQAITGLTHRDEQPFTLIFTEASTQKGPSQLADSNPEPSCCEAGLHFRFYKLYRHLFCDLAQYKMKVLVVDVCLTPVSVQPKMFLGSKMHLSIVCELKKLVRIVCFSSERPTE